MRVRVLAVGKGRRTALSTAAEEYLDRCARHGGVELVRILPARGSGSGPGRGATEEGVRILSRIGASARVVAMDEGGDEWSSPRVARCLSEAALRGVGALDFVIGGAFGLSEAVKERADDVVKLSAMTLPHELALLVLCEQLYRGFTLWRGEPYHH
ncbi:23S rRNA (pseudouridine(1915)-N(3))-methyltransferase RlmH [Myxococcota bacterium]|nr:23S rRNA (pseudouridine(1915)-N(3))-methyltransferase RlmH [Myxococcota bacterium]